MIVEISLHAWNVKNPRGRFRYRLSVIISPVLMYPVFQLLNPLRGSFYFREDAALFNSLRWLEMELWGGMPVGAIAFYAVVVSTISVVLLQEVYFLIKEHAFKTKEPALERPEEDVLSALSELSARMGVKPPEVWVVNDGNPVIFASGTKRPSIVVSRPLIEMLDERQMRSALAHELAHIARRSNTTTFWVFLFRLVMFFNPVTLLVFRRVVQDDEQVCDDITVGLTEDPKTLATTLRAFYTGPPEKGWDKASIKDSIENQSHDLLLKERIARLEEPEGMGDDIFRWERFALTLSAIAAVNYFIV